MNAGGYAFKACLYFASLPDARLTRDALAAEVECDNPIALPQALTFAVKQEWLAKQAGKGGGSQNVYSAGRAMLDFLGIRE